MTKNFYELKVDELLNLESKEKTQHHTYEKIKNPTNTIQINLENMVDDWFINFNIGWTAETLNERKNHIYFYK